MQYRIFRSMGNRTMGRRRFLCSRTFCFILLLGGSIAGLLDFSPVHSSSAFAAPARQVLEIYNPAGIREDDVFVDTLLKKTMAESGRTKPPLAGNFPEVAIEQCAIRKDAFEEINDLFYRRGWTDGLPIVPPTKERVKAMLKGADLSPDYLVAVLEPMGGKATIEKIAVNAVMAGCLPEYMPVLTAAVEAVADPLLNLQSVAVTTNPDIPMMIVSGPIVKRLDINAGTNTFGRGWKANTTISRALHLIIQNVGGSWPGVTDMSCLGQPGEISMMLAENDEANPWEAFHVDLGHPKAASVVTVIAAEGTHGIMGIGHDSRGFLRLVADHLAGLERSRRNSVLLIIARDTAAMLARDGWTRENMRRFIAENARIPFSRYREKFIETRRAGDVPGWVHDTKDPGAMIPVPFIDEFLILVSGGPGEKSMLVPLWATSKAVSREVRLSAAWEALTKEGTQFTEKKRTVRKRSKGEGR